MNYKLRFCPLTKIYNRYEFNLQYERIISNYNKLKKSFTFAIIDLDNFKKVNDSYGHPYWDNVLYVIWTFLKKQFWNENISVFRIWWEEFAILANDKVDYKYILEKLAYVLNILNNKRILEEREKIDRRTNVHPKDNYIIHKQTFSAWVKYFDWNLWEDITCKQAYDDVDAALYYVKHNGRNNIKLTK